MLFKLNHSPQGRVRTLIPDFRMGVVSSGANSDAPGGLGGGLDECGKWGGDGE